MSNEQTAAWTPADELEAAVADACAAVDLRPKSVVLLRHFATAVFRVDTDEGDIVVRVARSPLSVERSCRAVAVTRGLAALDFPTIEPLSFHAGIDQPVVLDSPAETAVTFWRYYPPTPDVEPAASHLAPIVRQMHQTDMPPVRLGVYEPLRSLRTVLAGKAGGNLEDDDRTWLNARVAQLLDAYAGLAFPLGTGFIHGDMHFGNLLWDQERQRMILCDWDSVCIGPREMDLIPTYTDTRFGLDQASVDQFAKAYGDDLRDWSGYPVLRDIRDLSTLTALIRLAGKQASSARELAHRLATLRSDDTEALWHEQ